MRSSHGQKNADRWPTSRFPCLPPSPRPWFVRTVRKLEGSPSPASEISPHKRESVRLSLILEIGFCPVNVDTGHPASQFWRVFLVQ